MSQKGNEIHGESDSEGKIAEIGTPMDRRQILKGVTGIALPAGLAGCYGQTTTETTTETTAESGPGTTTEQPAQNKVPIDDVFDDGAAVSMSEPNFNGFSATGTNIIPKSVIFTPHMKFVPDTGEWEPAIIKSFNIQETEATFTLDDRYTWHNGEKVTAEDIVIGWKLSKFFDNPMWDFTESVEATSDTEVKLTLKKNINKGILLYTLFGGYSFVDTPRFRYRDWLNRIEDASGDEQKSVVQELSKSRWAEPVGNGPFKFKGVSGAKLKTTKYEDHPYADDLNFSGYTFHHEPKKQQVVADMAANIIDGRYISGSDIEKVVKNRTDTWNFDQVWTKLGGSAVAFQFDHDIWGNRDARKAIAYLTNVKKIAGINPAKIPVKPWFTLTTPPTNFDELSKGVEFQDYGYDKVMKDKAAEHLRAAGFEKSGDKWVTSDGKRVSIKTTTRSNSLNSVRVMNTFLNDFGLKADVEVIESGYWGILGKGNFEAAVHPWNARGSPLDYSAFTWSIHGGQAEKWSYPSEVEVPSVGDVGGSNSMTVNIEEEMKALSAATSEQKALEIRQKLAWVCNQTVPKLCFSQNQLPIPVTTDHWEYPPADDPVWSSFRALEWLPHKGRIKAKTK